MQTFRLLLETRYWVLLYLLYMDQPLDLEVLAFSRGMLKKKKGAESGVWIITC